MFQEFALCFLVASVFSSTSFAMGKPKPGAFDATAWEGKYRVVDPACKTEVTFPRSRSVYEVEITVTPKEEGPTIEFVGTPVDPNPQESWSERLHQLNGKPYISSNTCWEDGDIFRSKVKGNAAQVQETVERMAYNWFCMPSHRVKERWVSFTALWSDRVLTVWGCSFRKL